MAKQTLCPNCHHPISMGRIMSKIGSSNMTPEARKARAKKAAIARWTKELKAKTK